MLWLILFGLAGLAVMAGSGSSGGEGAEPGAAWKETLFEPPNSTPGTAAFVVELVADGSGTVKVSVTGRNPPFLANGSAPDRESAIEVAYDIIEKQRGKLPAPLNRHGLRVASDCGTVQVQNLEVWLSWAAPAIDVVADELMKQDRLTAGQLMRGVWSRAFPECGNASPRIRQTSWSRLARQMQRIVDKQLAGDWIDVNPIGRVLAARMVGMSPPRVAGRAFFDYAVDGSKWAVIVDKIDTAVGERWRWRVWPQTVGGLVRADGDEATEAAAVDAAKAFVASMQASGVAFS